MDRVTDGQIIAVPAALNKNNRRLLGTHEWAARPELGRDGGAAPGIELAVGGDEARRVGVEPPIGVSVEVLSCLAKLAGVGVVALLGEEQFALALIVFGGDEAAEYCWLILRGTTAKFPLDMGGMNYTSGISRVNSRLVVEKGVVASLPHPRAEKRTPGIPIVPDFHGLVVRVPALDVVDTRPIAVAVAVAVCHPLASLSFSLSLSCTKYVRRG